MKTGWTTVGFGEMFVDATAGHRKTKQSDYLSCGAYPIVDQGQELVGGYTNDSSVVSHLELPVIVFGDHTRCIKYVDFPFGPGADGTKLLQTKRGVDPRFGYYALLRANLPAEGYSRHFKFLKEISIPLPPIEAQRRIAAVLDAADALRARRRQALARLDTLTQAMFIDMFGANGRSPVLKSRPSDGDKRWRPLGDLATMGTGHTPDRDNPDFWDGDVSWINLNEIRRFDGDVCHETVLRITPAGVANSSAVVHPKGTVAFSRTASIGFVTVMGEPMTTSQDFVTWTPGDEINPEFLMAALVMSRSSLRVGASGSTHKTIYVRDAERFHVLCPPRTDQDRFVAIVQEARAKSGAMESQLSQFDTLFTALQQRAFRGEL